MASRSQTFIIDKFYQHLANACAGTEVDAIGYDSNIVAVRWRAGR